MRHSADILDILPSSRSRDRSRIDEVEAGLFIGSMDGATDIVNLEVHGVTHIVTVIKTKQRLRILLSLASDYISLFITPCDPLCYCNAETIRSKL